MSKQLFFYSSPISPWGFMMMDRLTEWVKKDNIKCEVKIVNLAKLFKLNGFQPFHERSEAKLNYRIQDLERWKKRLKLDNFIVSPEFFPFNPELTSKIILMAEDKDKLSLLRLLGGGCWQHNLNMADKDSVSSLLSQNGFNAENLINNALSDQAQVRLEKDTDDAIENLIFSVPTLGIDNQVFWGQDRLDFAKEYFDSI